MTEQTPKNVSLYLTEGSSDKEYHAQLLEDQGGWVVNFQYGRRGKALKAGTKTASPVSFEAAAKTYEELVSEKMKKGYTPDVSGEVYQSTEAGDNFSGFIPQLPQSVRAPGDIESMVVDPAFVAQEKFDGDNRQVHVSGGTVRGINKRGMVVPLPMNLVDQVSGLGDLLASGEIIGTKLYLFDIQEASGQDLRQTPYVDRLAQLEKIMSGQSDLVVVPTARTTEEKRALMARVLEGKGEGVVFKRAQAHFRSGKLSASGSDQFKVKFTEDCTVRVKKVNTGKRSVEVEIDNDGATLALGNVSIPPNCEIPSKGELVSVGYLHLFEGGSLFQPQYKGVRTDCEGTDTLDMFKIKPKEMRRRLAV